MITAAERESFKMVRETCPDLDGIMDDLIDAVLRAQEPWHGTEPIQLDRVTLIELFAVASEKIKGKCTVPLREALVEVIEEKNDLSSRIDCLESKYL